MINPKKYIEKFERNGQPYDTRLDRMRLGFNEYVNQIDQELINEIINQLNGESLSAYPEVNEAYEAIAKYLGLDVKNILLGHGSDSVLFNILFTFCEEKETIASILPTYGMYEVYANMLNCNFVTVNYDEERKINSKEMNKIFDHNPKVVIIANPNGVIGTRIDDNQMIKFINEAQSRDVLVIIDEAYAEFSKKTMIDKVKEFNNLVVVRSFSKSLGMAGARIGYAVMDEIIRNHAYKMKPVVEITSLAVSAIKVLFKNNEIVHRLTEKIVKSRKYVVDELLKLGYLVLDTETNFILVNFQNKEKEIMEILKKEKIEIKKLNGMYEGYYRITVGTIDIMEKFINCIEDVK